MQSLKPVHARAYSACAYMCNQLAVTNERSLQGKEMTMITRVHASEMSAGVGTLYQIRLVSL